jgi:hypothetical protein
MKPTSFNGIIKLGQHQDIQYFEQEIWSDFYKDIVSDILNCENFKI